MDVSKGWSRVHGQGKLTSQRQNPTPYSVYCLTRVQNSKNLLLLSNKILYIVSKYVQMFNSTLTVNVLFTRVGNS